MIEALLKKIAGQIMALDETTLNALLPKYKERMLDFTPTREWEEAVIIYFLISGLKSKNSQFNSNISLHNAPPSPTPGKKPDRERPCLRLVRATPLPDAVASPLPGDDEDGN